MFAEASSSDCVQCDDDAAEMFLLLSNSVFSDDAAQLNVFSS